MAKIRFRLAKPSDAKQLTDCHWTVRDRYTDGIFLSLGKGFLRAYYDVVLDDPNEIVVCAENEQGEIVGFSSGSLDASSQAQAIKSHKFKLGIAALIGIIQHPSYLKGVLLRYKSLGNKKSKQFLHMEGACSEYLCWKKGAEGTINMMLLDKIKFNMMHELGVKEVFFEIDRHNERLFNAQLHNKTITLLEEYQLPDGRIRGLFKKILTK